MSFPVEVGAHQTEKSHSICGGSFAPSCGSSKPSFCLTIHLHTSTFDNSSTKSHPTLRLCSRCSSQDLDSLLHPSHWVFRGPNNSMVLLLPSACKMHLVQENRVSHVRQSPTHFWQVRPSKDPSAGFLQHQISTALCHVAILLGKFGKYTYTTKLNTQSQVLRKALFRSFWVRLCKQTEVWLGL